MTNYARTGEKNCALVTKRGETAARGCRGREAVVDVEISDTSRESSLYARAGNARVSRESEFQRHFRSSRVYIHIAKENAVGGD